MTYKEKFALLDKENKTPIETLYKAYYMFEFSSEYFVSYDKGRAEKEDVINLIKTDCDIYWSERDIEIINSYKKDNHIKEYCTRMYNIIKEIKNNDEFYKVRKLLCKMDEESIDYIIRKQKRIKFRKNIKRKRGG